MIPPVKLMSVVLQNCSGQVRTQGRGSSRVGILTSGREPAAVPS
jgi:hypothetical protein